MNNFMNATCFPVQYIKKKEKNGEYRLKIQRRNNSAWHMKRIQELQREFADAKIN